jgi:hypothetical protein
MITRPESPVYLRAIDEGDLETVHRWHNDPALYASLVGRSLRPASPLHTVYVVRHQRPTS